MKKYIIFHYENDEIIEEIINELNDEIVKCV